MSLDLNQYRVYVFRHERGPGRRPRWTAYTTWASASWEGCVVVDVRAANGNAAKREAIKIAKARDAFARPP